MAKLSEKGLNNVELMQPEEKTKCRRNKWEYLFMFIIFSYCQNLSYSQRC